jgi:hypothetical protein
VDVGGSSVVGGGGEALLGLLSLEGSEFGEGLA